MDFQPKVRHQDSKLFYITFGAFFLLGLGVFIFNEASRLFTFFIMAFCGLILFLIWQQNAAFDMRYQLLKEGIFLKRFFWKKIIPYQEIEKIEIVSQPEAALIINAKFGEEVQLRNQLNFKAFDKRKQVNELTQFISVPVVFETTNGGITIFSYNTIVKTELILIQTTDGRNLLISPIKMEEFVTEVRQKIQSAEASNAIIK